MKRARIRDLIDQGAIIAVQDGNHGERHPTAADYVENGIPFLMARDFRDGRIDMQGACKIPKRLGDSLRIGFAIEGDVLLTHKGTVGLTAIVPSLDNYVMLTPQVTYYRVDPEKLSGRFLKYAFQSPLFQSQLSSFSAQSTRPYIGITAQKDLSIDVPELNTQHRITGILSAYDDLIENNQRRIKILEEMARRIYREWFVYFRFPGHEDCRLVESPLGEIPEGWEVISFTEIADVLSGGTPKTDVPQYWDGEIPFFTPRDAPDCFYLQDTEKHISYVGLSKCASALYPPDTVFITARGTVGKVALPAVNMAMNQSCYALCGKTGVPQRFLFLMTLQQVDYLKTNTGGATFETIVVDTFRRMEVVSPSQSILSQFTELIDPFFEQVNTLQRQTKNLRRTRDLLLPRLLSGQIDVESLPEPVLLES
jgi:type I restriction enzyme S subunit